MADLEAGLRECKNRCYLYGLSTGSITFAGLYFMQNTVMKRMKLKSQPFILATTAIWSGLAAHFIIKDKTTECEQNWKQSRFNADIFVEPNKRV